MRKSQGLLRSLGLSSLLVGCQLANAALAQDTWPREEERQFSITTPSAQRALMEFGRQSGRELLFDYESLSGRRSNPIKGRYAPARAIELMLDGTGLRATDMGDGVLMINLAQEGGLVPAATGPMLAQVGESYGGAAPAADPLATVIVSGSRIPQQDATSASMPVLVVDRARIDASGQENIADVLLGLPAVGVGVGVSNTGNSVSGGAGLNLVNLRRLGVNRTLVLVNGRRQAPGAPLRAAVDLNTIPAPLVARTEVVTSGTSAVYGADAVTGVINIILRDDFEGLDVRGRMGSSSHGDADSRSFSITGGSNFELNGHAGNLTLSLLYDKIDGVDASDRSYGANGLDTIANPDNRGVNDGVPNFVHRENVSFNGFSNAGHFNLRGRTLIFSDDGQSTRPFDFGAIGNRAGRQLGGDGVLPEQFNQLTQPIERRVFAGTLNYELGEKVDLFLEARLANTQVQQFFQPVLDPLGFGNIVLSIDNPFLPADTVALMRGDPTTTADDVNTIVLNRLVNEFGRRGTDNDRQLTQYVAGISGTLPNAWGYELSYADGRTSDTTLQLNDRNNRRYFQSLDAVRNPSTGQIVCRDPSNGCVPLNLVGPNRASPEAIAFSRVQNVLFQRADQQVANANLTGELFELPAGPLQFAVGAEYRRESASLEPSSAQAAGETFLPRVQRTSGSFDVTEGFAELRVPILRDLPALRELSVNGAVRESDYSTSGRETAWHGGLEWQPLQGLRLRGVKSRSVRAPNLGELFSPMNEGAVFGQDPCDATFRNASATRAANCLALGTPADFSAPTNGRSFTGLFGGNTELIPETADTWTAGLVVRPTFLPRFTFVADYWRTEITDAIGSLPAQGIVNNCVDLMLSVDANPNCALVMRDPVTRGLITVQANQQNIGKIVASGVDAEINYAFDAPGLFGRPGGIALNLVGSYLEDLNFFSDANDPRTLDTEEGEAGDPRVQLVASVRYQTGPVSVNWSAHYIGDAKIASFPGIPSDQFDLPNTGSKTFHDLSVGYQMNRKLNLRLNVNNVFDERPPARAFGIHAGIGGDGAIYPNLGMLISGVLTYSFL